MWSSPGLHWCEPPPDDDDVADAEVAAVMEAAYALNRSAKAYGQALGSWHDDDDGTVGGRVLAAVEERFLSVPHLGCEHEVHGEERVFWLFSGAFQAMVCDEPDCGERLDWLIAATARLPWCALCSDRSPWLAVIETQWPLPFGRARVLVHPSCMWPDT